MNTQTSKKWKETKNTRKKQKQKKRRKKTAENNSFTSHPPRGVLVEDAVGHGIPMASRLRQETDLLDSREVPLDADGVFVRPHQVDLGKLWPQGSLTMHSRKKNGGKKEEQDERSSIKNY